MTNDWSSIRDTDRYRPLGLLTNPFSLNLDHGEPAGVQSEVAAAGNRLLRAIDIAAGDDNPKPIWVSKSAEIPDYYSLRAISETENSLVNDESLDILHAYIQLYMLRVGRIRATLNIIGERLTFRDWPKTLALYIQKILAAPDSELIAYQVLGGEALDEFKRTFDADPDAGVLALFGPPYVERRLELEDVGDSRLGKLEADVDEEAEPGEIDPDLGLAPGMDELAEEPEEPEDNSAAVLDYIVEYTKEHLSPVVARALRVYKERGLAAMSLEFRITKAPRKTLKALIQLARIRFRRVVLVYDGFGPWPQAPADVRSKTAGSLFEIRWLVAPDAFPVFLLERGQVPEIEEQLAGATRVDWDFEGVIALDENPNVIDEAMIDGWLAAAAAPGIEPLTMEDSVLAQLAQSSQGDLGRFVFYAHAAIEDAAERGVAQLDEAALEAGLAAEIPDQEQP